MKAQTLLITVISILLTSSSTQAQITIPGATQQPQWVFPLYFEDYNGDKDTIYFVHDSTATGTFPPDTLDTRFGERSLNLDTSIFTVYFEKILANDSIIKVLAVNTLPGLPAGIIILNKVRFPFKMKWVANLFYDTLFPIPNQYPLPSLMGDLWCADIDPNYDNCPDNYPLCVIPEDPLFNCVWDIVLDSIVFEGDTNFTGSYLIDFRIRPYASIVGINNEANPAQRLFSFSPNPTVETLTITSISSEKFDYRIYEIEGTKIVEGKASSGERLNISHLQKGFYLLQIGSHHLHNFKFIKL